MKKFKFRNNNSNIEQYSEKKIRNINIIMFLFQCIIIFISSMAIFKISEIGLLISGVNYLFLVKMFFVGLIMYIVFFKFFKKNIHRLTIILMFSIILFLYYNFKNQILIRFIKNLYENYNILYTQIYNLQKTYFKNFRSLLIVFLPLVYFLIFYITDKFFNNFMVFINFIVITILWFINIELSLKYIEPFFILTIFMIILNTYFKNIKNIVSKGASIHINYTRIICFIIILSFIVNGVVGRYLPIQKEGKIKKDSYAKLVDKFIKGDSNEYNDQFSLLQVGYSDNYKELGGPIEINKKDLMKVKTDKPRYLKGTVKSIYNGKSWKCVQDEYLPYKKLVYLDIYKISKELENIDPVQYYVEEENLEVELKEDFESYTFFSPNLVKNLRTSDSGDIYYDREQNLKLSKKIEKNYNISFFSIKDINRIEFGEELLKNNTKYTSYMQYQVEKLGRNKKSKWIDEFSYGNFDEIIKTNFQNYMSLPNNISKETYSLVEKLTKDANTPLEKVNNIKDYLENNYKYSLNVSNVPEQEEFLNYFLFKEKKGYCTYFATAMTVMSRIAGVPARYVEGFKMGDRKDKYGRYLVGSEDAHAWCEVLVYPDKNLWSIADPKVSQEGINNNNQQAIIDANNRALKERRKQKEKERIENTKKKQTEKKDIEKKQSQKNYSDSFKVKHNTIVIIVLILLSIILVLIFILNIKRLIIIKSKSIIPLYKHCIFILRLIGIKNSNNLSDMEFVDSIRDKNLQERLKVIVREAYKEKYGGYNFSIDKKYFYKFINKYARSYIIHKLKI